jgi:hypothetical protein
MSTHYPRTRLPSWISVLQLVIAMVAAISNDTWDDVYPGITYSPTSAWIDQSVPTGFVDPNLSKVYQRTWYVWRLYYPRNYADVLIRHAVSTSQIENATVSIAFRGILST